jgi:hypothetical protein
MAEAIRHPKTPDVKHERDLFLKDLKLKVDAAFSSRMKQTWNQDMTATDESIEKQRNLRQGIEGLSESEVLKIDFSPNPATVSVDNSHDYPDLLKLAFEKLVSEGLYSPDTVKEDIEAILKHEQEHSIPALGQEGVRVRFNVTFFEDESFNDIGIIPSISLAGNIPLGLIKRIAHAVEDPGEGDKIWGDQNG